MLKDTPLHALVILFKHHEQMLEAIRNEIKRKTPNADPRENLANGEHVPPDAFDAIEDGALGCSKEIPYRLAPLKWHEDGIPYGAWCECQTCTLIGRSTFGFDFYAPKVGAELKCEVCEQKTPRGIDKTDADAETKD